MAQVQLVDVYEPTAFNAAVQEDAVETNAFIQSGVLQRDARIDMMVEVGGMVGEMPSYNPLTRDEPDYTTDAPADVSVPANISSYTQSYRLSNQHKSWSTMDLARQLALADPLGAITGSIGGYWATNTEQRVVSSALGVLAENIAGADDMSVVNAITTGTITAANLINSSSVLDTTQTLGDRSADVTAIAMHSVVYNNLRKDNLIAFVPASDGKVNIPEYLGLRVIVDDSIGVDTTVANYPVYTSILFGMGAFGYGTSAPLIPSEIEREASLGNGGGQSILHSRFNEIVHPQGYNFDPAGILQGVSATRVQLAAATSWTRVVSDRKNVSLAFLKTNG